MVSIALSTIEMPKEHTSMNIAESMKVVLDDWKIFDKIVAIVSDNASNIKKAISEFLKKRNQNCVAHTLNLVINDCIKNNEDFNNLIGKCRAIVAHFKRSNVAAYKLREIQQQMGLEELKLKQDIATRWNSIYFMLERLDKIKVPLSAALTSLSNSPDNLSSEEWNEIANCVSLFKPMEQLTSLLSGDKYPTLSSVIPLIRNVQASTNKKTFTTPLAAAIKHSLLDVLNKRLGILENNKTAATCSLLDPRFKKGWFRSRI
ncbi:hypothetical protein NQ314_016720 [Rhamnusium bicolor]|uniref:Uncharacterized protein n=1 Tax=Rhamnusium bicolor TaxID=1586634 RepID=A0AAV8WVC0_9CUCU|nr:hypothetical protein NQ314_016720 [Rhamnusium bicolor]